MISECVSVSRCYQLLWRDEKQSSIDWECHCKFYRSLCGTVALVAKIVFIYFLLLFNLFIFLHVLYLVSSTLVTTCNCYLLSAIFHTAVQYFLVLLVLNTHTVVVLCLSVRVSL